MIGEIDAHYIQYSLGISLNTREISYSLWTAFRSALQLRNGTSNDIRKSPLMDKLSEYLGEGVGFSSGYFNISKGAQFSLLYFRNIKLLSYPLLAIFVSWNHSKSVSGAMRLLGGHLLWSLGKIMRKKKDVPERSLRKLIDVSETTERLEGSNQMVPIRLGR